GALRAQAAALSLPLHKSAVLACSRLFYFLAGLLALWQRGGEALIPASLQPDAIAAAGSYVLREHDVKRGQRNFSVTTASTEAIDSFSCRLALYTAGSTGAPKRV